MQAEMYRKEGPLPRQLVPPPFQLPTGKMKANFRDADVRPQGKRDCGVQLDIELGPTLLEQSNADACEEDPFPRTGGFRDARGTFCWSRMLLNAWPPADYVAAPPDSFAGGDFDLSTRSLSYRFQRPASPYTA